MTTAEKDPAPRRRSGRPRRLQLSRIYLVPLAIVLAVAAFMFWPASRHAPVGIGEQHSVVTADAPPGSLTAGPRSGDVAIAKEVQKLVPEQPAGKEPQTAGADAGKAVASPAEPAPVKPEPREKARETPRETSQATSTPAAGSPPVAEPRRDTPAIQPQATGPWLLQLGAFGKEENAEKLLAKLQAAGFSALLRAGNLANGSLVYRVCIGYFASRDQAVRYGRENAKLLGEQGVPVHR
jgi:cell division septation protein DedD